MKNLVFGLFLLILVGCGAASVTYDYDKEVDFDSYNYYAYYPEMTTGLNQLDERRLTAAIDSILHRQGVQYTEEPHFYINISSWAVAPSNKGSIGLGMGGGGGHVGGGVSVGVPLGGNAPEYMVRFDFVDVAKDQLFWQATSRVQLNAATSPAAREAKLQKLAAKVFSKYPPGK